MKKKTVKLLLFILVLAVALTCAACSLNLAGFISPRTDKTGDGYSIKIVLNGGTGIVKDDFVSGTKLVEPTAKPTRMGYSFTGWYADADCEEAYTFGITLQAGGKYVIYAGWTAKTPEATFVFGAGIDDVVSEAVDGKFTPPEAERAGYELTAWYLDNGLTREADFDADAVDGTTFYAGWTANRYTITYNYGGIASAGAGTVRSYTVEDSFDLVAPAQSSVESGYVFLYWENEQHERQNAITSGTTGNRTFTAVYVCHNAFIEAVTGGKIIGYVVNIGVRNSVDSLDLYSVLTASDNATVEIFDEEEEIAIGTPVALTVGTKAFTAVVTSEYGEEENTYTLNVTRYDANDVVVTFHYPDATTDEEHVAKGDTVEAPTAKSIVGKEFNDWYQEAGYANLFDFNADIIEDTDVYAKYNLIEYEIAYYYGIGSAPDVQITAFDVDHRADMVDAVAPTGYAFSKYTDEDGVEIPYIPEGSHENVTLYAHYVKTGSSCLTAAYTTTNQAISSSELLDYYSWAIAYRHEKVTFTFTDEVTSDVFNGVVDQVSVLNSYVYVYRNAPVDGSGRIVGTVEVDFTYAEPNEPVSTSDAYTQYAYKAHEMSTSDRANDYDDFAINYIDTYVTVRNSDQLVYATMMGYRPLPVADSVAEAMYDAAKAVLREIVDDSMTNMEKAHAIYDWIIMNVVYDNDLLAEANNITLQKNALIMQYNNTSNQSERETLEAQIKAKDIEIKQYNGFYLEGVFTDRRAVCDGISKAYALMCNIEGIPCVQVSGTILSDGNGHAWNKVYLDGNWYVVDPTHGGTIDKDRDIEMMNHSYFLMTDAQRLEKVTADDYTELVANDAHNVYADMTFTLEDHVYDYVITSRDELTKAIAYFGTICSESLENQTIDFYMNYSYASVMTELQNANDGFDYAHYDLTFITDDKANGDVIILIAKLKS